MKHEQNIKNLAYKIFYENMGVSLSDWAGNCGMKQKFISANFETFSEEAIVPNGTVYYLWMDGNIDLPFINIHPESRKVGIAKGKTEYDSRQKWTPFDNIESINQYIIASRKHKEYNFPKPITKTPWWKFWN